MNALPEHFFLIRCKAYISLETLQKFITAFAKDVSRNLWIAAPFTYLEPLSKNDQADLSLGVEMLLDSTEGSLTSAIAGKLLNEKGAQFALIGSVDERKIYSNSGEFYKNKVRKALSAGIRPVICLQDTFDEHLEGRSQEILKAQLDEILPDDISQDQQEQLYFLYDAAWINRTPWEAGNPEPQKGYQLFNDVLLEKFEDAAQVKRICAVPYFSPDFSRWLTPLKADGYSLGIDASINISHT